jgi:hypothetical protein
MWRRRFWHSAARGQIKFQTPRGKTKQQLCWVGVPLGAQIVQGKRFLILRPPFLQHKIFVPALELNIPNALINPTCIQTNDVQMESANN